MSPSNSIAEKLKARLPSNLACCIGIRKDKITKFIYYTCYLTDRFGKMQIFYRKYYGEHKMNDVVDAFLYLYLKNV